MQTPIQVSLARVDREEFINAGVILFSKPATSLRRASSGG